jgi:hypothetical protein
MSRLAACALLALAALRAPAMADSANGGSAPPDSRGRLHVYAGLFGSAHLVAAQATDYRRGYLDHGAGGGVLAGVRLNRLLAVEAAWRTTANRDDLDGARVTNLPLETMVVTAVTAGPRVYWPTDGPVEPYALFSLGYAAILTDFAGCPDCDTLFAGGPAAELGAGVDLRLGRHVSAGLRTSGQLLHFAGDSFEKRFRQADVEPSRTATTILSLATDAYAAFHF